MVDHGKLFSVEGKTALVTGGAKGLGRTCAEALLSAGARVIIASRKGADCMTAAAELSEVGDCVGLAGDVGTEEGVADLARAVGERFDHLDILVNNAGLTWGAPLESFPWAAWNRVMNVNLFGAFELTKMLLPLLRHSGSSASPACVVNLGSVLGTLPLSDQAYSYAASKAALHHLTRILANELASDRILVNAIAPGPFASRMTSFALADKKKSSAIASGVPLGRLGEADDLAGMILFLCSRAGAYVTGAVLPLDGGMTAQTRAGLFSIDP